MCFTPNPLQYHWWGDGQYREALFFLLLLVFVLVFPCSFLLLIPFSILGQPWAILPSGVSLLQCGSLTGTVLSQGYPSKELFSSKVFPSPVLFLHLLLYPFLCLLLCILTSPPLSPFLNSLLCPHVSPPESPAPAMLPSLSSTEWSNLWKVAFVVGAARLGSLWLAMALESHPLWREMGQAGTSTGQTLNPPAPSSLCPLHCCQSPRDSPFTGVKEEPPVLRGSQGFGRRKHLPNCVRLRVHSWQCPRTGLWGAMSLASEGSLHRVTSEREKSLSDFWWTWSHPPQSTFSSSTCILAFLYMGVFRKRVQREFPPCKMSHPFTSPKEAKAAEISVLKWKDCWIGSQHKLRYAHSSATGELDPALQNAFIFLLMDPRLCLLWCI